MTQNIKKQTLGIETLYEQQIRKARQASRNLTGFERAIKICDYFESVGHPHTRKRWPISLLLICKLNNAPASTCVNLL